jgi:hypothetical protein
MGERKWAEGEGKTDEASKQQHCGEEFFSHREALGDKQQNHAPRGIVFFSRSRRRETVNGRRGPCNGNGESMEKKGM